MKNKKKASIRLSQKEYDLIMSFTENKDDSFAFCFRSMVNRAYVLNGIVPVQKKQIKEQKILKATYTKLQKIILDIEKSEAIEYLGE